MRIRSLVGGYGRITHSEGSGNIGAICFSHNHHEAFEPVPQQVKHQRRLCSDSPIGLVPLLPLVVRQIESPRGKLFGQPTPNVQPIYQQLL